MMPGIVSNFFSEEMKGIVRTVSSPLLHQSDNNANHQTVHITPGREERAPCARVLRFCIDGAADLMEFMLDQLVILVAIRMIPRQDLQSLVLPVLGDQPARTLRYNQ